MTLTVIDVSNAGPIAVGKKGSADEDRDGRLGWPGGVSKDVGDCNEGCGSGGYVRGRALASVRGIDERGLVGVEEEEEDFMV